MCKKAGRFRIRPSFQLNINWLFKVPRKEDNCKGYPHFVKNRVFSGQEAAAGLW